MAKSTATALITETSSMQIFARVIREIVGELAVITSVAIACQMEFADISRAILVSLS